MVYLQNDPYYPYYYHDKKHQQEYLFLYGHDLESDSYFDEDFLYPYPFGMLLCKCLNILNDIVKLIKEDNKTTAELFVEISSLLESYLPEGKDYNTSIDELRMFAEYDLFQNDRKEFDYNKIQFYRLTNCLHYVELCANDKKYSNLNCLAQFASLNSLRVKNSFKALNGIPPKEVDYTVTSWEIKMYLDKLNNLDESGEFYNRITRQYYVDLFGLDSLCDFILVSLSELFAEGKTVNQCKICGKFFIPQRVDTEYCNGMSPNSESRTCRQENKLRKQNERVRLNDIEKMYRSISQMKREKMNSFVPEGRGLSQERNVAEKELYDFQEKYKEMQVQYKKHEITEWQFSNWLKSFYRRKHK